MVHAPKPTARFIVTGCLVLGLSMSGGVAAQAQFWEQIFGSQPQRPRKYVPAPPRRHSAPQSSETFAEPHSQLKPGQFPLIAVVSIASQKLAVYDSGGAVLHSRVSSGQSGHRTPLGVFKVIQKDRYHESNIYSGAPMPYMQRITWSGIAMHAGYLPGYAASHGCIRLPEAIAAELFKATKVGMLVVVSPTDVAVVPITHPALPVPLMMSGIATSATASGADHADTVRVAALSSDSELGRQTGSETGMINPHQRALQDLPRARKLAAEAVQTAKDLLAASQRASAEATMARADFDKAERDLAVAVQRLAAARAAAVGAANSAGPIESEGPAAQAVRGAEQIVADATTRRDDARAIEAQKSDIAFAAADAWRAASTEAEKTAEAAKAAARSVEPVSVFISRKAGRIFVRQGFHPVFDAPVTFKGSGRLGTHVFTVMTADERSGLLGWRALSVPETEPRDSGRKDPDPLASAAGSASAVDALERVEIDADVMHRLNERIWLGGSVIISDHGLGEETGTDTDFVVQTR